MTDAQARAIVRESVITHMSKTFEEAGIAPARHKHVKLALAAFTDVIIDAYLKCLLYDAKVPKERVQ